MKGIRVGSLEATLLLDRTAGGCFFSILCSTTAPLQLSVGLFDRRHMHRADGQSTCMNDRPLSPSNTQISSFVRTGRFVPWPLPKNLERFTT